MVIPVIEVGDTMPLSKVKKARKTKLKPENDEFDVNEEHVPAEDESTTKKKKKKINAA